MTKKELIAFLAKVAKTLDKWAIESQLGGWSTHQVNANKQLADECRVIGYKLLRNS